MNLRTEEYRQRLVDAKAEWSERNGRAMVTSFGAPINEYWSVRDGGLGLADRSERDTLVLTGGDTIPWLQGLVTSDLMALEPEGSGQRSCAVNHVGRAITDMALMHAPEMLLVDLEPGVTHEGLVAHLRQHIIMEKVALSDRTETTARLSLFGRLAPEVLADLARLECSAAEITQPYWGSWGDLAGCDVIVQRTPWVGEPGFDIYCDRAEAHRVWDALMGASQMLRPVGEAALEIMRKEAGHVRFGVEFTTKNIPVEADLNDLVAYNKGCFLGQEIIHRLDTQGTPSKMLRVLVPQDPQAAIAPDQRIELPEGKKVGTMHDVFASPQLEDRRFGLAYLKRGAYEVGQEVLIGEDEQVRATVAALGAPLQMSR